MEKKEVACGKRVILSETPSIALTWLSNEENASSTSRLTMMNLACFELITGCQCEPRVSSYL